MNDYLVMPIIFVMILIFFFNYMIMDSKFHKAEMRDMDLKYKLENINRQLDRLKDEIRRD